MFRQETAGIDRCLVSKCLLQVCEQVCGENLDRALAQTQPWNVQREQGWVRAGDQLGIQPERPMGFQTLNWC